jgi:hypothetical protein
LTSQRIQTSIDALSRIPWDTAGGFFAGAD